MSFAVEVKDELKEMVNQHKELLTMVTRWRNEQGIHFEAINPQCYLGEGSTAMVFPTSDGGVLKCLKEGYESYAKREVEVLKQLKESNVTKILPGELIGDSIIYFSKNLDHPKYISAKMVDDLISTLQASHEANVIHRDVTPANIMVDENDNAYLIDWGCSYRRGEQSPPFEGTWKFASDEVFSSAIEDKSRIPEAKEDLESLVRSVLEINQINLRRDVESIQHGNLHEANWRSLERDIQRCYNYSLYAAARRCDYKYLKNALV